MSPSPNLEFFPVTGARRVPVDLIEPGRYQPRVHFDAARMAELTESVRQHDVMQPILLRPIGTATGDKQRFEIVAGERRWRASKAAMREDIPAVVRELTLMQVLELQAIENIQREDLHPMEEAYSFDLLLNPPEGLPGYTVEQIAEKVGKSTTHVRRRLVLCQLIPQAAKAFTDGLLTLQTALTIARMPVPIQGKAFPKIMATRADETKQVAHRDAEKIVQGAFMLRLANAPFPIKDATLVPDAGGCNVCPKRTGACPDLFDDVAEADTCTDPDCFDGKQLAHNERRKAEARADGIEVMDGKKATALLKFGPDSAQLNADYVYMDEPLEELTGSKSSLHKLLGTLLKPSALYEHPRDKTLREIVHTHKAREVLKEQGLLMHRPTKGDKAAAASLVAPDAGKGSNKANTKPQQPDSAQAAAAQKEAEKAEQRKKLEAQWRRQLFTALHNEMHDNDRAPDMLVREAVCMLGERVLTLFNWDALDELWGWTEAGLVTSNAIGLRLEAVTKDMHQGQLMILLAQLALIPDLEPHEDDYDAPEALLICRAADLEDDGFDPDFLCDWRGMRLDALSPRKPKGQKTSKTPIPPTNEPTPAGGPQGSASQEGEPGKPHSPEDTIQAPSAQGSKEYRSDLAHWVGQMVKVKGSKRLGEVVEIEPNGDLLVAFASGAEGTRNLRTHASTELTVLPGQQAPAKAAGG